MRLRNTADAQAWNQFVDIYTPLIFGFFRKRGLQDADALDLTQETLQAIRTLEYDRCRGRFRGWLWTVMWRGWCRFREKQCIRGAGDTATVRRLEEIPAQDEAAAESGWNVDYQRRKFHWAAGQLRSSFKDTTWQAFWQTAVEGKKPKEVGKNLGISVAAVYTAKSTVLARVKKLIQEVDGGLDDEDLAAT